MINYNMYNIVLASSSPRRKALLEQLGLKFEIIPADVEEKFDASCRPEELSMSFALLKARHVASGLKPDCLVIGADTIVVLEKQPGFDMMLGKPADAEDAFKMLKLLQGRRHRVITGVAVVRTPDGEHELGFEETDVYIRSLSDYDIRRYINTGEPMDKAGAYGIQGIGSILVERIEGCCFNVVGLPLARLDTLFKKFGVDMLSLRGKYV